MCSILKQTGSLVTLFEEYRTFEHDPLDTSALNVVAKRCLKLSLPCVTNSQSAMVLLPFGRVP